MLRRIKIISSIFSDKNDMKHRSIRGRKWEKDKQVEYKKMLLKMTCANEDVKEEIRIYLR